MHNPYIILWFLVGKVEIELQLDEMIVYLW